MSLKCTEEAIKMINNSYEIDDDGKTVISSAEFIGNIAIVRNTDGDPNSAFTCYDVSKSREVPKDIFMLIKNKLRSSSESAKKHFKSMKWNEAFDKSMSEAKKAGSKSFNIAKNFASKVKSASADIARDAKNQMSAEVMRTATDSINKLASGQAVNIEEIKGRSMDIAKNVASKAKYASSDIARDAQKHISSGKEHTQKSIDAAKQAKKHLSGKARPDSSKKRLSDKASERHGSVKRHSSSPKPFEKQLSMRSDEEESWEQ